MSSSTRFSDVLKSDFVRRERENLADYLLSVGPDAPTLCEGWNAKDLAVHLVIRESRPDAVAGAFISPLRDHSEKVTKEYEAKPFEELVAQFRSGPPLWSLFKPFDRVANVTENFVHLEDVRRAGGGETSARDLSAEDKGLLWFNIQVMSKMFLKNATGPVVLVWGDRRIEAGNTQSKESRSDKSNTLTVEGDPQDILLWLFGREEVSVPHLTISDHELFDGLRKPTL